MKKFFLILLCLLLTGCSAEYRLTYDDDEFTEDINVIIDKNNSNFNILKKELINKKIYAFANKQEIGYYDSSHKDLANSFIMNYNYTYDFTSFRKSRVLKECFELASLTKDEENYYILSKGNFKCLNFNNINVEELKIVFETKHKVIKNNADNVKGNKYIWNFSKDNYKKNIEIVFSREEKDEKVTTEQIILFSIIGIISIGFLIFIIYNLFIAYKHNKED